MAPRPHLDHPIDAQGTGRGDGTLQLDGTARAGGVLSGVVSAPSRIAGSDVLVHVECVRTSPSLSSGPFHTIMWRRFVVLDGTRLAHDARVVSVPFAFQLPDTAMPTDRAERLRVDWLLRVEAPGAVVRPRSGLSWGAQASVAAGGLALAMALVVMLTTTRVVVGAGRVRLERGLLGVGFHTTLDVADMAAVEETGTDDRSAERFYGVDLRMKDGRRHSAVMRERDAARARALAWALESALGGRVAREVAEPRRTEPARPSS
jgi:hypothetical protein